MCSTGMLQAFACLLVWISVIVFSYTQTYLSNQFITKTRLFEYIENFTSKNWKKIQIKNSHIFQISAQNIDCGYSLESPQRGGSNEYPQSMF